MEFSKDVNGSLSQLSAQGTNLLNNLKNLNNGSVAQGIEYANGLNALGVVSGFQGANTQFNPAVNLAIPPGADPTVVEGLKQWLSANVQGSVPMQTLPNCLPGAPQLLSNPLINPLMRMKFTNPSPLLFGQQPATLQNPLTKVVPGNALNTPSALAPSTLEERKPQKARNKATKRSRYRGVYWNKGSRSWRSLISINGKTQHLGNFVSQEEAAQEFDRKARELKRTKLNFPDREVKSSKSPAAKQAPSPAQNPKAHATPVQEKDEPDQEPASDTLQAKGEDEVNPKCKSKLQCPSSKYRGVYFVKQRNEWRARIWNDGKSEHLGNFETEEEAAKEFDKRSMELGRDNLNFPESKV